MKCGNAGTLSSWSESSPGIAGECAFRFSPGWAASPYDASSTATRRCERSGDSASQLPPKKVENVGVCEKSQGVSAADTPLGRRVPR